MTWEEWVNSEYNTVNAIICDNSVSIEDMFIVDQVFTSFEIEATSYSHAPGGFC